MNRCIAKKAYENVTVSLKFQSLELNTTLIIGINDSSV